VVTQWLRRWTEGDPHALARLVPLVVCDELRRLAERHLRHERAQTTRCKAPGWSTRPFRACRRLRSKGQEASYPGDGASVAVGFVELHAVHVAVVQHQLVGLAQALQFERESQ